MKGVLRWNGATCNSAGPLLQAAQHWKLAACNDTRSLDPGHCKHTVFQAGHLQKQKQKQKQEEMQKQTGKQKQKQEQR